MRVLSILLLAAVLHAADDRTDPVFGHLRLKPGVQLLEGSRGLDAAFPYIKGLTPHALPRFVEEIRDVKQAADAVRLFVAGAIVRDRAQAERIVAAARELKKEFKHLRPTIKDYRPESYEPSAKEVADGFEVSFVAFEMGRILQLVHVVAKVKRDGTVALERRAIVSGPMTSWQTAMIEIGDERDRKDEVRTEEEMRAEAVRGRARYARALKPARDLDTAWAFARLALSLDDVEDLWGKPDHVMGSGLMIRAYDLADGTAIMLGAGSRESRPTYVRHIESARSPAALHTLYSMPSRRAR